MKAISKDTYCPFVSAELVKCGSECELFVITNKHKNEEEWEGSCVFILIGNVMADLPYHLTEFSNQLRRD